MEKRRNQHAKVGIVGGLLVITLASGFALAPSLFENHTNADAAGVGSWFGGIPPHWTDRDHDNDKNKHIVRCSSGSHYVIQGKGKGAKIHCVPNTSNVHHPTCMPSTGASLVKGRPSLKGAQLQRTAPSIHCTPPATGMPTPPATGMPTPPATGMPTPPATGMPTPVDTGTPTPVDTGTPTPVDTGTPTPPATGTPTPPATPGA